MQVHFQGNMADVIRTGDRIRKAKNPWWPATHQVLTYLDSQDWQYSPRVLAESDTMVELTYLDGETIDPSLTGFAGEQLLRQVGRAVRSLHDTLLPFHLEHGTRTVPWTPPPSRSEILCHNDLSPWNTVLKEGELVGFIDWDLVSPGSREWELAWVCWRFAPIYPTGERTSFTAAEQASRCATLLTSYGRDAVDIPHLLDEIDRRMQCGVDVVEDLGAAGVPGFDRLLASGLHLSAHDDRAWYQANRTAFAGALLSDS